MPLLKGKRMRTIKTMKEFLNAKRKTLLLDGDQWIDEMWYATDPCSFCRVGCVFYANVVGGNEGTCLNCGRNVYWNEEKAKWRII